MESKRILVSGAAGFIGSHLCKRLLDEGYRVTGIDNLSNGKIEFIEELKKHDNFDFVYITLSSFDGYYKFHDEHKFDVIFHLAANSEISNSDPYIEYRDTFSTTHTLLEYCRRNDVKEFIFTSSGSVYGEAYKQSGLIAENYGPLMPISHYAAAKLASEAFISSYSYNHGIKSWICRLPNVIGPHATHGVILDFINKIKANPDELEVLGDGTQTKPYMHVSDVIDAMLFIWRNANDQVNFYNIAGIGTTLVKTIAEQVIKAMGTRTLIRFTGGDRGWQSDSPKYFPDNRKLGQLGYKIEVHSTAAVIQSIKEIINELTEA